MDQNNGPQIDGREQSVDVCCNKTGPTWCYSAENTVLLYCLWVSCRYLQLSLNGCLPQIRLESSAQAYVDGSSPMGYLGGMRGH